MTKEGTYKIPPVALLDTAQNYRDIAATEAQALSAALEARFADRGIYGQIVKITPTVEHTCYAFKPLGGTFPSMDELLKKVAREVEPNVSFVSILSDQPGIARICVRNKIQYSVRLGDIVSNPAFTDTTKRIPWGMGWLCNKFATIHDLADISPVLAIGYPRANTAVFLHTLIISVLYRFTPQQCRIVLINTEYTELKQWTDIPHLVSPIAQSPAEAISALQYVSNELQSRLRRLQSAGVQDIIEYTGKDMPNLVVIVDELCHLMTDTNHTRVENCIRSIAQHGETVGIYMVAGTRRADIPYRNIMLQPADNILTEQILEACRFRALLFDDTEMSLNGRWQPDIWTLSGTWPAEWTQKPHIDAVELERVADFVCKQPCK